MVYRRAVDAVIWGAPAVTLDMMRQAYFRDAKASYNDIIWWPQGVELDLHRAGEGLVSVVPVQWAGGGNLR